MAEQETNKETPMDMDVKNVEKQFTIGGFNSIEDFTNVCVNNT